MARQSTCAFRGSIVVRIPPVTRKTRVQFPAAEYALRHRRSRSASQVWRQSYCSAANAKRTPLPRRDYAQRATALNAKPGTAPQQPATWVCLLLACAMLIDCAKLESVPLSVQPMIQAALAPARPADRRHGRPTCDGVCSASSSGMSCAELTCGSHAPAALLFKAARRGGRQTVSVLFCL